MILETIVSSTDKNGQANFAPVGVHIPDHTFRLAEVKGIKLYLYRGSQTFANLQKTREGVVNFTDDVSCFVDTALFSQMLPSAPSRRVRPPRMAQAKTVWEFAVASFDDSAEPAEVLGEILVFEELAGFAGLCRAQGVILEAAVAATRLPWISPGKIEECWPAWREVVAKTGGLREKEALDKLALYFAQRGVSIPGWPEKEKTV